MEEAFSSVLEWLLQQSAPVVICMIWIYLERRERLYYQTQNEKLSKACIHLAEETSLERVLREEQSMLSHDSAMRSIAEAFVKSASRKRR